MIPIFSIIVPFYNSEKTLYNCIKSIIDQKIERYIEIIVIDDSSNDNSLKVFNKNFKKKKYIKIYKNSKNKGVSYSRNVGIKNSKGKYLVFLDSDDVFLKKKLKKVLNLALKKNTDILYINKDLKRNFVSNSNSDILQNINKLKSFTCHTWNFIIKRNFLLKNKIFFQNIKIFEDQPFVTNVLISAKTAYFINDKILSHFEYFNSLSRKTNFKSTFSYIKVLEKILKLKIPHKPNSYLIRFVNERLNFIRDNLKLYSLILNKKEIQISLNKIKFLRNQEFVSNVSKVSNFENIFKYKNIFKRKIKTINQVKFLKKTLLKKHKVYIFSCGIYGRILAALLKQLDVKVSFMLDNNKHMYNNKYLGIKICNPKILSELGFLAKERCFILIGHNNNKIKKEIANQIQSFNIKKTNIIKINYF